MLLNAKNCWTGFLDALGLANAQDGSLDGSCPTIDRLLDGGCRRNERPPPP